MMQLSCMCSHRLLVCLIDPGVHKGEDLDSSDSAYGLDSACAGVKSGECARARADTECR